MKILNALLLMTALTATPAFSQTANFDDAKTGELPANWTFGISKVLKRDKLYGPRRRSIIHHPKANIAIGTARLTQLIICQNPAGNNRRL